MPVLIVILNLLWLFLGGGLIAFLLWTLGALLLAITIIGIPFAVAAFRIGLFTAWPFGRKLEDIEDRVFGTTLANILWILLAGIWLFIAHVVAAVGLAMTIIGLPFAWAHVKIALAAFAPLGKRIVSTDSPADPLKS